MNCWSYQFFLSTLILIYQLNIRKKLVVSSNFKVIQIYIFIGRNLKKKCQNTRIIIPQLVRHTCFVGHLNNGGYFPITCFQKRVD